MIAFLTFVIGVAALAASLFFAFGCGLEMEKIGARTEVFSPQAKGREGKAVVLYFTTSMVFAVVSIALILASGRIA